MTAGGTAASIVLRTRKSGPRAGTSACSQTTLPNCSSGSATDLPNEHAEVADLQACGVSRLTG